MKLTFKITAGVLLTVMTLLLFFGFFIIKDEKEFLTKLQNKQGKAVVDMVSISILDAVLLKDYPAIDTIIENTINSYKNIVSIRVIIDGKTVSKVFNKGMSEDERVIFKSSVEIEDQVLAKVVSIISNSDNLELINKRIRNMIFLSVLIASFLVVILILIVKYFLINKINFISKRTKQIELNNLHKSIKIDTNDEFKDLTENINEMTKKLAKEIDDNKIKTKLLSEQSKMAAMGEMIGNIAHQWRQPLSVISTAVTGMKLQKECDSLKDEDFFSTCDTINTNTQYLSQTIEDFRNYLRGDSEVTNFNIQNNIKSFLKLIDSILKSNNINIVLRDVVDMKISGHPNELQQCFISIFHNSKDALQVSDPNKKYFFIQTQIIDKNLIIKLKDNAGGISEEIIDKIFEPYFTTKHKSIGTGLGLSMTYDLIVNSMNGTIEAKNVEYEYEGIQYLGVEFIIKLPQA